VPSRFEVSGAKGLLRLLDAVMAIGSEQTLADALRRITETAAELVDAEHAALGVLDESGSRLAEFITVGSGDEEPTHTDSRAKAHRILGLLAFEPHPLRLPDLHRYPRTDGFPPGYPPMTTFLGVPIRLRGVVYGNLYMTDKANHHDFSEVDQELAVGLAAAAGLAIENARLHEVARTAGLLVERERIARDLHDDVIQRLFATGLSLQAAARLVTEPIAVERITRAVDELDVSIRQVRATIFDLHELGTELKTMRGDILAVCDDSAKALGFTPTCRIDGPVDRAVHEQVRGHVLLCLREALSNVARHAEASNVEVTVSVHDGRLVLHVADDGVGYHPAGDQRSSGIDNMQVRAESLGGSFKIEQRPTGGTLVTWNVPLGSA
jgi:signal transduction histidine kinase